MGDIDIGKGIATFESSRLQELEGLTRGPMKSFKELVTRQRGLDEFMRQTDGWDHAMTLYSSLLHGGLETAERTFAKALTDLTHGDGEYSYAPTTPFNEYRADIVNHSKKDSEIPVLYAPIDNLDYDGMLKYLREEPRDSKLKYLKAVESYTCHFDKLFRMLFRRLKRAPDSQLQGDCKRLYRHILTTWVSAEVLSFFYGDGDIAQNLQKIKEKDDSIRLVTSSLGDCQSKLISQRSKHDTHMRETISKHNAAFKEQLSEHQAALNQMESERHLLRADLAKIRTDYDATLDGKNAEHEDALKKLRAEHEDALGKLRAEHEDALKKENARVKDALKKENAECEEALKNCQGALKKCQDDLKKERTSYILALKEEQERYAASLEEERVLSRENLRQYLSLVQTTSNTGPSGLNSGVNDTSSNAGIGPPEDG